MAIRIEYPVLDCPDPGRLARFYRDLLDANLIRDDPDWAEIDVAGWRLAFQQAPDFVGIDWPESGVRFHLDFVADDPVAARQHARSLGAELVDDSTGHPGFEAFRDPAGHYFCLCRSGPGVLPEN